MVVSTYQAASGAGAAAMEELKLQTQEVHIFFYKLPCPVNVFVWLNAQCFTPYFRSWKGRRQHATFSNSRLFRLTN
jgi:aspartate-semialdehyde dehydrogenase